MGSQQQKEQLLLDLVQEYIETASPVSSGALLDKHRYNVSSATLRNWMAELEEAGFLAQPHTSSGRIPTPKAYRFFVDKVALGAREPVSESAAHRAKALPANVRHELQGALKESSQEAARHMARYLAEMSNSMSFAGILGINEFYRHGLRRLLDEPEFLNADNVRSLVDFADSLESEMEKLFTSAEEDVRIIIGSPNRPSSSAPPPHKASDGHGKASEGHGGGDEAPFSIMAFTSELPNNERGVFGIIGPMRMRYGDNLRLLENIRAAFEEFE